MSFHPAYFSVRFRVEQPVPVWPSAFVIVTAYATTGEQWPAEQNERANDALRRWLEALGVWHRPITGYDPATGHAEPGWAVEVERVTGVELGGEFRQDAIFCVKEDTLELVSCLGAGSAPVGGFRERLDGLL